MTTVAANLEMLAVDSQVTAGNTKSIAGPSKLKRVGDKVFAATARTGDARKFSRWVQAGMPEDDKPSMEEGFAAVMLSADGLTEYYDDLEPVEIAEGFTAVGSGAQLAIGAMAAGASPERALHIACEWNIHTGPPVVVEKLEG